MAEVGQFRRGAAVVMDIARQGPAATTASLFAWARDPEIYALVLDGRGVTPEAKTPQDAALADALWRLDCFSKPTVTLLGRDPATLVLALGLAGTHRVIDPEGMVCVRDLAAGACPPAIVLRALARMPGGERYLRTGAPMSAQTALSAGIVTHVIAADAIDAVVAGLADAEPVDPLLDNAHRPPVSVAAGVSTPSAHAAETASALAAQSQSVLTLLPELAHLDLRAATLRLEALLRPGAPFDLPSRETLQSLRAR